MHLSTWTYPWDLARLRVDAVLADLADHGLHALDLAATYHPISALSPRGTLTPFFSPAGAVFFPARPQRYRGIVPDVWPDADVVGVWPGVSERLDAHGLRLDAWTICLFQPWMAQRHPGTAREFATGQRLDAGVCPSNPDVRTYLIDLVADLLDQFPVGVVKLEGIAPPRYDYGWFRRRVYTTLTPAQELALGLCFCPACRRAAEVRGIDGARARSLALELLDLRSTKDGVDAELIAYAGVARDESVALARAVADAVHAAGAKVAIPTPVDGVSPGVPIEGVLDVVDVVLLAGSPSDLAALQKTVDALATRSPRPELEYFVHPPFVSHAPGAIPAGIQEELTDPAWRAHLDHVRALGVGRLSLYNYGLLTPETFARLVALCKDA